MSTGEASEVYLGGWVFVGLYGFWMWLILGDGRGQGGQGLRTAFQGGCCFGINCVVRYVNMLETKLEFASGL